MSDSRPGRSDPGLAERPSMAGDSALGAAVDASQQGDERAFRTVYDLVHPMLLSYARGMAGEDAEDIVAEAWYHISRDLKDFSGDGAAFRAWAATITRLRTADHFRRQRRRPPTTELDQDLHELPGLADTPREAQENLSTERALYLIAMLPEEQAQAIMLRVIIGLNGPAAAVALNRSHGAVRTAAYRGLRTLASRLSDGGEIPASGDNAHGGDA